MTESTSERKGEIAPHLAITASNARDQLGELINRTIAGERVVITRHGKPICALISAKDAELLAVLEQHAA